MAWGSPRSVRSAGSDTDEDAAPLRLEVAPLRLEVVPLRLSGECAMPNDYIPRADAEFDAWLGNFEAYAAGHLAGLGLVAGDLAPVSAAQSAWASAYEDLVAAQNAAQAARQAKDAARTVVESAVRPLVRRLQASASVDHAERAALGITVPDTTPTPVGPPTTRPVVKVDARQRLQHTIHFTDEATPTRKARPAGVSGAEIWVHVAPVADAPPIDPAALTFIALDTRTPYTLDFDGPDGGQNAHYMLRWLSTTGQKGPWSETVSATVGA